MDTASDATVCIAGGSACSQTADCCSLRPGAPRRPPSTTWGAFLRMHLDGTIAIDFLTVPTVTFNVL